MKNKNKNKNKKPKQEDHQCRKIRQKESVTNRKKQGKPFKDILHLFDCNHIIYDKNEIKKTIIFEYKREHAKSMCQGRNSVLADL